MSVNIVTPWYINKVKNVLFHCYFLFQVNMYKWWIFLTDFTISNALKLSHSSLENATGRPTAGDFFSPFVYACISCFFLVRMTFVLWSPFYSAENFENFERTSLDCGVILKLCVLYGTHAVVQLFFPCS